jgi:hypothetical protein
VFDFYRLKKLVVQYDSNKKRVLLGLTTLIAQSNQTIIYPIKIGIKWSDGGGGGGGGGLILGDRQAQGACWDNNCSSLVNSAVAYCSTGRLR